ncbi:MAG: hypothetical protein IIY49_10740 [Eubacterium sp.]|nr:hypothetical protein [Eubacterium sp.]
MEKNKVVRAKKIKPIKNVKKPDKAFEEKKSVKKLRKSYEKALKKASPERTLSIIALILTGILTVLDYIDKKDEK